MKTAPQALTERTMKDFMRDEPSAPAVVDRGTFQAELDALRVREKAHTREGDAIAAARRRLPMVEVDGTTRLIGERGAVTPRSLLRTAQAIRASLLASAIASTLWCSRFLAASIQGLSPWRSQLLGLISTTQ